MEGNGAELLRGLAVLLFAYGLGSVPFGYWIVRLTRGADIRTLGSGNIGATNVQRILGAAGGVATLLLDGGKGAFAVWISGKLVPAGNWAQGAALLVVLGHSYPIFLRFRGGKGVATGGGAFLVLCPAATLATFALFGGVLALGRMVSLASVSAATGLPLFTGWMYGRPAVYTALAVGALVVFRHRRNLKDIWLRRERRLGDSVPASRD